MHSVYYIGKVYTVRSSGIVYVLLLRGVDILSGNAYVHGGYMFYVNRIYACLSCILCNTAILP